MSSSMIGITLGDPSGIGPEIIASTLHRLDAAARRRLRLFGDLSILERAFVGRVGEFPADIAFDDLGSLQVRDAPLGTPTRAGAEAQVAYLEAAVAAAKAGELGALVTGPISKHQVASVGFEFPGHTEFLQARFGASRIAMMFVGPRLRVVLATIHLPLAQVPASLSEERIVDATELAVACLRERLGIAQPRAGVVALNPHAGEQGMLGREEIEVIAPAIERCRETLGDAASVSGPIVPDVAFRRALDGDFDVLVAMYHDQALIPIKAIDFEHSVNCTLGLPIVRTSPDHGVAYDIAGKGLARHQSFAAALALAMQMVDRGNRLQASGDRLQRRGELYES